MYKTEAFLWLGNFLFNIYSNVVKSLKNNFYPQLSLTKRILAQSCSVDVVIFCITKTFSCITVK